MDHMTYERREGRRAFERSGAPSRKEAPPLVSDKCFRSVMEERPPQEALIGWHERRAPDHHLTGP